MNTQFTLISSLIVAFLWAPAVGDACQPRPSEWMPAGAWPGDGAVDVPVDADVLAFFRDDAGEAHTIPRVTITVVDVETEAPIEGRIHRNDMASGFDAVSPVNRLIWRPDMPFEPGRSYAMTIQLEAQDEHAPEADPVAPIVHLFTTAENPEMAPDTAPTLSFEDARTSTRNRDLIRCLGELVCGEWCEGEEEVYDTVPEFTVSARLALDAPAYTGAMRIQVGYGQSPEGARGG